MEYIRFSDAVHKLSAGRRTIVRWLENDRSLAGGRSFTGWRTIVRRLADKLWNTSKKLIDRVRKDKTYRRRGQIRHKRILPNLQEVRFS